MADRDALALNHIHTAGGHIKQHVNKVIFEQIHLVNVEEAAISAGEEARRKSLDALGQRTLNVKRPADTILRRAERQVNDRHRNGNGERLTGGSGLAWLHFFRQ